jgi:hypothetical protein
MSETEPELDEEPIILEKPKTKEKKPRPPLTEAQKEQGRANLAKGRAIRDENRVKRLEENKKIAEEIVEKKVEKVIKSKQKKEKEIKKLINYDSDDNTEIEEHITVKKKPKKKKIVYREEEESDSEEEVVVIKKKKKTLETPPPPTPPTNPYIPLYKINFV